MPRVAIRLRARLARTAATAAPLAVMLFALLASDATYPVVAEAFALPETTALPRDRARVALVVRGQPRDLLAWLSSPAKPIFTLRLRLRAADRHGGRRAYARQASTRSPATRPKGVAASFDARGQLQRQIASYNLSGHFYYIAPHEGFTITDYLLAREARRRAPPGRAATSEPADATSRSLRPGEVIVTTLGPERDHDQAHLLASVRRLERAGFATSSVQRLASIRHSS